MNQNVFKNYDALKRRRTKTLIKWWDILNSWDCPEEIKPLLVREMPPRTCHNDFRNDVVNEILRELGLRLIKNYGK